MYSKTFAGHVGRLAQQLLRGGGHQAPSSGVDAADGDSRAAGSTGPTTARAPQECAPSTAT